MDAKTDRIEAAYRTLGLPPGASLGAAKDAFRERVKSLHPDCTPPTDTTLSALSDAIAAMRCLESLSPLTIDLEVTASAALQGATRLVSHGLRRDFVRIPPGTQDGCVLDAVGDSSARITIRVREAEALPIANGEAPVSIETFVRDFAAPSPATRFARWIRGPRSAA